VSDDRDAAIVAEGIAGGGEHCRRKIEADELGGGPERFQQGDEPAGSRSQIEDSLCGGGHEFNQDGLAFTAMRN
jgi:hypothetical protein